MSKLRELRKGELTTKDMSILREGDAAKVQHKKTSAAIKDYSLQHYVKMTWKKNSDRILRPFSLLVDSRQYILSWSELKEMDSAGFFRREKGVPKRYNLQRFDGPKIVFDTHLNEEAERDMIVRITSDRFEVICDWYEMMRAGRFI